MLTGPQSPSQVCFLLDEGDASWGRVGKESKDLPAFSTGFYPTPRLWSSSWCLQSCAFQELYGASLLASCILSAPHTQSLSHSSLAICFPVANSVFTSLFPFLLPFLLALSLRILLSLTKSLYCNEVLRGNGDKKGWLIHHVYLDGYPIFPQWEKKALNRF